MLRQHSFLKHHRFHPPPFYTQTNCQFLIRIPKRRKSSHLFTRWSFHHVLKIITLQIILFFYLEIFFPALYRKEKHACKPVKYNPSSHTLCKFDWGGERTNLNIALVNFGPETEKIFRIPTVMLQC